MPENSHRRRPSWPARAALAAVPLAVAGVLLVPTISRADGLHAHATLRTADGTDVGTVRVSMSRGTTTIGARLHLPGSGPGRDAFHGFHLHANDNPGNGNGCVADPRKPASTWFVSADGHLSRPGQTHGSHQGDLPSLFLNADGTAHLQFTTARLTRSDLVGRAVIVHSGPDNFGNVPVGTGPEQYTPNSPAAVARTAESGNSGYRLACGVLSVGGD